MSHDHDNGHGPMVNITVDGKVISIHRGHQTVSEIKTAGGVSLAYDLEQIMDGVLVLLPDDSALTLKGEEIFVSHPKDSSSS